MTGLVERHAAAFCYAWDLLERSDGQWTVSSAAQEAAAECNLSNAHIPALVRSLALLRTSAVVLAEETGEPVARFESDAGFPPLDDLECKGRIEEGSL